MAGEILLSKTLKEAKEELRDIYKKTANKFEEITEDKYDSFNVDEREDSDNHLNEEKLGKNSDVIDLAYYKFLPNRQTAYRIILKHKDGKTIKDFFLITPELN